MGSKIGGERCVRVAPLSREIETVEPHLTLQGIRIAAGCLGLTW